MSRRLRQAHHYWGDNPVTNVGVFGILSVLYLAVSAVVIGLALYVLVLAIISSAFGSPN